MPAKINAMQQTLQTYQIADFALHATYEQVGAKNIDQLKKHLLDALGSLVHATDKEPILKLKRQLALLADGGSCTVPVAGKLPYDRAAQLFTALIRYPDFMDNYMGKEATCHPSDNLGPLLAAAQFTPTSGKELLTAMAVAYQVQCRLVNEIPVMKEGIDHTLLLAYSMVAGIARLLGLNRDQAANALAISGCAIAPMVTSRASYTSEWKGMASSMDALDCMNNTLLALQDMTGPVALFEGPKGFAEVFDMKLDYNWAQEHFDLIHKCVLKKYNAEVHSQPSIEAAIALRDQHNFSAGDITHVEVTTFLTAYHIIGSGAYGDRKMVRSKEQADHSLHYLIAVALLDGEIYPEQLTPERINQADVQTLLKNVDIRTKSHLHKPVLLAGLLDPYTEAYPDKMKTTVKITLADGRSLEREQDDYPGFFTRPFSWEQTIEKFRRLTAGKLSGEQQQSLIHIIQTLDERDSRDLIDAIAI